MRADLGALQAWRRGQGHGAGPSHHGGVLSYESVSSAASSLHLDPRPPGYAWGEAPYIKEQPAIDWALERSVDLAEAMDTLHAERVSDPTDFLSNECVPISLLTLLSEAMARRPSLCDKVSFSTLTNPGCCVIRRTC